MKKLLILGAGSHGKVIAETAIAMNQWSEIHFLDNREDLFEVLRIKIIGKITDLKKFKETHHYGFVALGNNKLRLELIEELENLGFKVPNIIYPRAFMSQYANLSNGIAILPRTIINTNTFI